MAFSKDVQVEALVACGRCCCLCHKFCGPKIELHHITQKADGGADSFDNCIPLCFECHADMGKRDSHHPKGKGYSPEELRKHRDKWYQRKQASVSTNITDSDKQLFSDICEVFQPLKYTLAEYDLANGVKEDRFNSLTQLLHEEGNPFKEFLDGDLESGRKRLVVSAIRFKDYFNYHMFTHMNRLVPHIYLMSIYEIDYEAKLEKLFQEEANILNSLALELWNEYQDFVRLYRQRAERENL